MIRLEVPFVLSKVIKSQWLAPDKVGGVEEAHRTRVSQVTVAPPVPSWQTGSLNTPPATTPEKFIVTPAWPSLTNCCVPFSQLTVKDDEVATDCSLFTIVPAVTFTVPAKVEVAVVVETTLPAVAVPTNV